MPAAIGTCSDCRFWDTNAISEDASLGRCRYSPPVATVGSSNRHADWPVTQAYDWCGQYVLKA